MNRTAPLRTWLCYYGLDAPLEAYGRFDLVVFDATYHPALKRRADGGPILLGYLSAAEVLEEGPWWTRAQSSILVEKRPQWNSWVVDLRDAEWQEILIREAVPRILDQGFDGLFLDTLDSALALELWRDAPRYKGTVRAAVRLLETLRSTYPDAMIAVNRGLPVLPRTAAFVDVLVLEGLSSIYEGPETGYIRVDEGVRRLLLEQLEEGLKKNPRLPVLTLDYASEDRPDLVWEAIANARRKGFVPYVATNNLDRIQEHTLDPGSAPDGPLPRSGRRAG